MAQEVVDVERALLALPPQERAAVVPAALISFDGGAAGDSQDEIDVAWRDEVAGRLAEAVQGTVALGSFEATRAEFAARYPSAQ